MQNWSALLILSALATAHALPPADCSRTISVSSGSLTYNSQPQFPRESEYLYLYTFDAANPFKPLTLCGFTFKADRKTRVVTVSTSQFSRFPALFRRGVKVSSALYFRNVEMKSRGDAYAVFDPSTSTLSFEVDPYSTLTVGVKIDGGPIQPLYFGEKARMIKVPRNAKLIDLYAKGKYNVPLYWERVTLNLPKATIQMYDEATFPMK